jgi:uncharacterized protein
MITLPVAAGLAAAVLSTSFISGIFGMAGGMILLGILLALMPVAPAMVLHGMTQMASNGWRAWLWRRHIKGLILVDYAAGALVAAAGFAAVQLIPSKAIALIILGLTPFVGLLVPASLAPNVMRRGQAVACGAVCTVLQLLCGVSGPILDVFFVRSPLDRREMVATKAAIQAGGHLLKVAYFGQLLAVAGEVAPVAIVLSVVLALVGTQLSRRVLEALSDAQFRAWTRRLIIVISTFYLVQGLLLLT